MFDSDVKVITDPDPNQQKMPHTISKLGIEGKWKTIPNLQTTNTSHLLGEADLWVVCFLPCGGPCFEDPSENHTG